LVGRKPDPEFVKVSQIRCIRIPEHIQAGGFHAFVADFETDRGQRQLIFDENQAESISRWLEQALEAVRLGTVDPDVTWEGGHDDER
jgi:hypothetical protein